MTFNLHLSETYKKVLQLSKSSVMNVSRYCEFCHDLLPKQNYIFCSFRCDLKMQELIVHLSSSQGKSMACATKCVVCKNLIKNIYDVELSCGCIYHEKCLLDINYQEKKCSNCKKKIECRDLLCLLAVLRIQALRLWYKCQLCKNILENSDAEIMLPCKCVFHSRCYSKNFNQICPHCGKKLSNSAFLGKKNKCEK